MPDATCLAWFALSVEDDVVPVGLVDRCRQLDERVLGRPVTGVPPRHTPRGRLESVGVVALAVTALLALWFGAIAAGMTLSIASLICGFLSAAAEGRRRAREAFGDNL